MAFFPLIHGTNIQENFVLQPAKAYMSTLTLPVCGHYTSEAWLCHYFHEDLQTDEKLVSELNIY